MTGGGSTACEHARGTVETWTLSGVFEIAWCQVCGALGRREMSSTSPAFTWQAVRRSVAPDATPERVQLGWIVRTWDEANGEHVYLCSTGSGDSSNEPAQAAVFTKRARAERAMAAAVAADSDTWDTTTRIVPLVRKAAKP